MVPLGARLGGAGTTGLLLSATFIGSAFGPLLYTRLLRPGRRTAWMAVTATAACAVLTAFALSPPLAAMIVILGVSGACTGYIPAAAGVLFGAIPEKHHGKAGGVLGAGMSLSQGVLVLAAGAAAARVSPVLVIALLGLAGTACGIPLAWAWHRIRKGQRHA
jgi:MFS family permease